MPQLIGIKTVSDTVIECGGYRYEKTEEAAQVGDIVRCDSDRYGYYSDITVGAHYVMLVDHSTTFFYDDVNDRQGFDPKKTTYLVGREYFSVFRRTTAITTADIIAAKRAERDRLNAEIVKLTAQLADKQRPKVGDYALTLEDDVDIPKGSVVAIRQAEPIDYEGDLPFLVRPVFIKDDAMDTWVGDCRKLTPAEARAALIEQVDAIFYGLGAVTSEQY